MTAALSTRLEAARLRAADEAAAAAKVAEEEAARLAAEVAAAEAATRLARPPQTCGTLEALAARARSTAAVLCVPPISATAMGVTAMGAV